MSTEQVTPPTQQQVAQWDDSQLYETLALVNEEIRVRVEGGFAEAIREFLRDDDDQELRGEIEAGGGAVKAWFGSSEWEDGWFYSDSCTLTLANGGTSEVDIDGPLADHLTELSAVRRGNGEMYAHSALTVDLVTGAVEHG